jgi:hypothetical protein
MNLDCAAEPTLRPNQPKPTLRHFVTFHTTTYAHCNLETRIASVIPEILLMPGPAITERDPTQTEKKWSSPSQTETHPYTDFSHSPCTSKPSNEALPAPSPSTGAVVAIVHHDASPRCLNHSLLLLLVQSLLTTRCLDGRQLLLYG